MDVSPAAWDWISAAVHLVGAVLVALLLHRAGFGAAERLARRADSATLLLLLRHARRPAAVVLPLLAVLAVLPVVALPPRLVAILQRTVSLGLIASFAWLAVAITEILDDLVAARFPPEEAATLRARKVRTQVHVLRRIAVALLLVIALAAMLMTFPTIRNLGASLFASAGVAGLIVGLAARPALSNLLAGLQIALTEPIRLEDSVIVEGEFGFVEEIGTTYVVIRTWDLRRLIVPLSYFIERPFQNWTRKATELLGTVFVYTDYTVPVEEVRQEARRILEGSELWDGRTWGVDVTNLTDRAMELRVLLSARDSSQTWRLRCLVRERLIAFLQARYPQTLPRVRTETASPGPPAGPAH
jgi:small-conductance mechanosensitive channel